MNRPFPMFDGPPIPWALAEVIYAAYDRLYGHDQTLEKMAERGGFGWAEVGEMFTALQRRDRLLWRELMERAGRTPEDIRREEALR